MLQQYFEIPHPSLKTSIGRGFKIDLAGLSTNKTYPLMHSCYSRGSQLPEDFRNNQSPIHQELLVNWCYYEARKLLRALLP
jgi:hypothetical protein